MLEKEIQAKIKKELERQGWLVLRPVNVSVSGLPDLWCLKAGMLVFVEVKKPGEKPTERQRHRHQQLRAQGFDVHVFTDASQVHPLASIVKPNL